MATDHNRQDKGRAALAADLIADLAAKLPLGHPARDTVRELQKLFTRTYRPDENIRRLLERVPGKSLQQKGEQLGIPRGAVWAIWHGKYRPSAEIMARIEAAAEKVDA